MDTFETGYQKRKRDNDEISDDPIEPIPETSSKRRRKEEIVFVEATPQSFVALLPARYGINLKLEGSSQLVDKNTKCFLVKLKIPLPKNYPKPSHVAESEDIQEEGLFSAGFHLCRICKWKKQIFKAKPKFPDMKGPHHCLILMRFYVNPKKDKLILNAIDKEILNGLGKLALCVGVNYFYQRGFLIKENTLVLLEASGGATTGEENNQKIQQLMQNQQHLRTLLHQKYSEWYFAQAHTYNKLELAECYVAFENNKLLVNYYTNTFGFKTIDAETDPNGVLMATPLTSFIEHCKL